MSSAGAPQGLSGLSAQIYEALERYTAFPWPVLKAQCERVRLDPQKLTPRALEGPLLDYLVAGVTRFTNPRKGAMLRDELVALVKAPVSRARLT